MSQHAHETIRREADLIGRVAAYYRTRFGELIDRMNRQPDAASDLASIRLCVEAVDMMLASQGKIAQALGEMSGAQAKAAKSSDPHVRPAA